MRVTVASPGSRRALKPSLRASRSIAWFSDSVMPLKVAKPNIRVLVVAAESEREAVNDSLAKPPLIGGTCPTYTFPDMATARNWLAAMPPAHYPRQRYIPLE